MLKFLKYVLATIVGLFLFWIVAILILAGIGMSADSKSGADVEANSILKIDFGQAIIERDQEDNPFKDLNLPGMADGGSIGIVEFKKALQRAKKDDKIKGIYLELSSLQVRGFASVEEIRNALLDFKTSGKFVYAYGETMTEMAYYIASLADKIYLNPVGMLEFNGLSSNSMYFKGMLEKLEIKPEIFRVGEFKSAVEPFFLDKMSPASRLQTSSFLNSINSHLLAQVSKSRKIDAGRIKLISDSMLVHDAKDALTYGLITNLGYYDQLDSAIHKAIKAEQKDKLKFVSLGKYSESKDDDEKVNHSKNRIAVIVAAGEIRSGKSDEGEVVGSETIAKAIRDARLDDKVKAIVIRVNSPGGSALASDVMWREIILARKTKPVIASMSDLAASGGYYISMGCDKIVAQPTTITGSIGVFGLMFNTQNFLKNKIGITTDNVSTGYFSDLGNSNRPLTDFERRVIQQSVNDIYTDFTTKAAQGRKMSVSQLQKLAGGRVWSGTEALQNGLVDKLGGLDTAIALAAQEAKLGKDDFKIKFMPSQQSFFDKLFDKDKAEAKILRQQLGQYYDAVNAVRTVSQKQGVQALLPFNIYIR